MHLCLWNYKLIEGFRQISADTNCSGSRTFLPQSGPDVIWQADSCTETVKGNICPQHCYITVLSSKTLTQHTVIMYGESLKPELTSSQMLWKSSNKIVQMMRFFSLQVWLEPTKPVVKQVRSKSEIWAEYWHLMKMCVCALMVCSHVFQDQQIHCLDWQWNSSLQTPVSCRRSTRGQWL